MALPFQYVAGGTVSGPTPTAPKTTTAAPVTPSVPFPYQTTTTPQMSVATPKSTGTSNVTVPTPKTTTTATVPKTTTTTTAAKTTPTVVNTPVSTTVNPQGLTPAQMSALASKQMEERTQAQSVAAPGTIVQGAPTGMTAGGQGIAPTQTNYQAYTTPTPTAPSPTPTPQATRTDPYTGNVMVQDATGAWRSQPSQAPASQAPASQASATGAEAEMSPMEKKYMDLLDKQQERLDSMQKYQEQLIQQQTEASKASLAAQQKSETGTAMMQLARMGALGTSASGVAYMQSMESKHQQEILDLDFKKQQLLIQAQDAYSKDNLALAKDKLDLITKLEKDKEDAVTQNLQNRKLLMELDKMAEDDADKSIANWGKARVEVPEDYLDAIDQSLNRPVGISRALLSSATDEQVQKDKMDELDLLLKQGELQMKPLELQAKINDLSNYSLERMDKINGILSALPAGTPVQIGGATYYGFKGTGNMEVDAEGYGRISGIDPTTGRPVVTEVGYVGSKQDGWTLEKDTDGNLWRINARTNQRGLVFGSDDVNNTWRTDFPDGTQSPYRDDTDPMQGQCAALWNDLYGGKIMGSTWQEKLNCVSKYEIDRNQVQVGDTVIEKAGSTGHVFVVEAIENDPQTGKPVLRAFESNMVPPNGRQISHSRTIPLDSSKILSVARVPLKNLPATGPDAPARTVKETVTEPTTPKFGTTAAPKVVNINGVASTWNERTGKYEPVKIEGLPGEKKTQSVKDAMALIKQIKESPSLHAAVGPISQMIPTLRGSTKTFENRVTSLKSILTLDNMGIMKGVLSDSDMKVISAASSALSLDMGEEGFKQELDKIEAKMKSALNKYMENVTTEELADEYDIDYQAAIDAGWTDDMIRNDLLNR